MVARSSHQLCREADVSAFSKLAITTTTTLATSTKNSSNNSNCWWWEVDKRRRVSFNEGANEIFEVAQWTTACKKSALYWSRQDRLTMHHNVLSALQRAHAQGTLHGDNPDLRGLEGLLSRKRQKRLLSTRRSVVDSFQKHRVVPLTYRKESGVALTKARMRALVDQQETPHHAPTRQEMVR